MLTISPSPVDALIVRPGQPGDAAVCGRICYEAFQAIANAHQFEPEIPSADFAVGLIETLLSHPSVHPVVAEREGRVVGSNFLWEQGPIAGVGPISRSPPAAPG